MQTLFKNITIDQAKDFILHGANIVDIRDEASYAASHVENAIHLTNDNLHDFIRDNDLDKPLLVFCYHGHSSQNAAQFLAEQGFEEVYSVIGGFAEWQ